jgi:hypothetical protein
MLHDETEMVTDYGQSGITRQCALQQEHSIVDKATLGVQQAEVTKSARMFRVDAQNLAVQNLCLVEVPIIVQSDRPVEGILDTSRAGIQHDYVGFLGADDHDLLERRSEKRVITDKSSRVSNFAAGPHHSELLRVHFCRTGHVINRG